MSYFDDYIADGLCCESCGALIDSDEPGFVRMCAGCASPNPAAKPHPKPRANKRRRNKGKGHG